MQCKCGCDERVATQNEDRRRAIERYEALMVQAQVECLRNRHEVPEVGYTLADILTQGRTGPNDERRW